MKGEMRVLSALEILAIVRNYSGERIGDFSFGVH